MEELAEHGEDDETAAWTQAAQTLEGALEAAAKARKHLKVATKRVDAYRGTIDRSSDKDLLLDSVQQECVALSKDLMRFLLVSAGKRDEPKLRALVPAAPPREVVSKNTLIPRLSANMVRMLYAAARCMLCQACYFG
jgi:hypothetical protein